MRIIIIIMQRSVGHKDDESQAHHLHLRLVS